MFSIFSRFSANNIDRINRSFKPENELSDEEFTKTLAQFNDRLDKLQQVSNREKTFQQEQQSKKKENKSLLSKVLGGDTNQMIFGAMVFAFLVIATMGVAASAAGPLAVAAMGTFAAAVGGAVVAKAVKKFRNRGKSQGNFAPIMSRLMKDTSQQFQKQMNKDLEIEDQGVAKDSGTSFSHRLLDSMGLRKENKQLQRDVADLTKKLIESQENEGIKGLEDKIMKHAKDVLGSDFKTAQDHKLFEDGEDNKEKFGTFITKLKQALESHADSNSDGTTTKLLKELVDKCDSASDDTTGIKPNEKKLVYGALKDIFKDCKGGSDKGNALKDAIKKDSSGLSINDQVKSDVKKSVEEITQTVDKEMNNAKADDKTVNDKIKPKVEQQER